MARPLGVECCKVQVVVVVLLAGQCVDKLPVPRPSGGPGVDDNGGAVPLPVPFPAVAPSAAPGGSPPAVLVPAPPPPAGVAAGSALVGWSHLLRRGPSPPLPWGFLPLSHSSFAGASAPAGGGLAALAAAFGLLPVVLPRAL